MMYSKEGSVLKIKPVPPLFVTSYDKKFNGKSWETELGLNIYDFDARGYMLDIVRTFQHDPLAEMFYDFSPQSFLNNNPLHFIDPTGMGSEDWKRNLNGELVFDKNLNQFNSGYTLGIGEQYVGASHYEVTTSNNIQTHTLYKEDGSIISFENEAPKEGSTGISLTSDCLLIYGVGGDAIAGSGDVSNDRGSGSMDMPGHDFNTLFDLGGLLADMFVDWTISNPTTMKLGLTMKYGISSSEAPTLTPTEPVSQDTIISLTEHHYVKNTYYNGKSETVPRVSFSKDTVVSKKDVQKTITNNDKKNESNRKNAR